MHLLNLVNSLYLIFCQINDWSTKFMKKRGKRVGKVTYIIISKQKKFESNKSRNIKKINLIHLQFYLIIFALVNYLKKKKI